MNNRSFNLDNSLENKIKQIDSTKYLLESSLGRSNKNQFSISAIKNKFNNTEVLINDKTSMLIDREIQSIESEREILNEENYNSFGNLQDSILSLSESFQTQSYRNEYLENNLSIDKPMIHFGICFPGEKSKKFLKIKNKSLTNQLNIEACITTNREITINEINSEKLENSFYKYKCFSFSANLIEKDVRFLLKEDEEVEIEIYVCIPFLKKSENLFTIIQIANTNIFIPITVNVEIPKLLCLKSQQPRESQLPLINLRLELKSEGQKFRIPFKNLSSKDIDLQISVDTKNNMSIFVNNGIFYECQLLLFPNTLTIINQGCIDIIAKIKKTKIDENINQSKITNKIRKILIAKIKNSTAQYLFFVEAEFKN